MNGQHIKTFHTILLTFLSASTVVFGQGNLSSQHSLINQTLTDINIGSYIKDNLKVLDINKGLNKVTYTFPTAPGQDKTISWKNFRNTSINSSGNRCLIDISEGGEQKKSLVSLINGEVTHVFGAQEKVFFYINKVYVIRDNGLFEFINNKYVSAINDMDFSKYNGFRKFGQFIVLYDNDQVLLGSSKILSKELIAHSIINLNSLKHENHLIIPENWMVTESERGYKNNWIFGAVNGWNSSNESHIKKLSSLLALFQGSTYDREIFVDRELLDGESYEILIQDAWRGDEFCWMSVNENGKAIIQGKLNLDPKIGGFDLRPPVGNPFPVISFKNKTLDILIKKNGIGINHYTIRLNIDEIERIINKKPLLDEIKVKPEKNKVFRMSEYGRSESWNLLKSESSHKLYFSAGLPHIYEFDTRSIEHVNSKIFEQTQREMAIVSAKIENASDSLIMSKSDFQGYKDIYELFVAKAETLKKELSLHQERFYISQTENIKVDTLQNLSMFNSSNYSLQEEQYFVSLSFGETHIPINISVNKKDAEQLTTEDNLGSYWIIYSALSPLRKKCTPFFVELIFKDSAIFSSIVPEYSFEVMDNLSFANNKYRDEKRHQEFNSEIYSYHIAAGGLNNYFDYSDKFQVKRINKLGYQADFSQMQSWYLYDKLINCCPKKSDYRDGSDGIGLYLGEYGLVLNANLPYCDGHEKFIVDEKIGSELFEKFNGCIRYWDSSGLFSIKSDYKLNIDKSKSRYSSFLLKISKDNNEIAEVDLLAQANNPKEINLLTYRISPNRKYIAVLVNQILSVYRTSDFKEISKFDLQVYFDFQIEDFYAKVSNRLYWDNNSNYLGYENLLFQIPLLEKFN